MNGPGGFQRAASKAGAAFHVAGDGEPAGACEAGRTSSTGGDREPPGKHKTASRRAPHGPAASGRARESTHKVKTDVRVCSNFLLLGPLVLCFANRQSDRCLRAAR